MKSFSHSSNSLAAGMSRNKVPVSAMAERVRGSISNSRRAANLRTRNIRTGSSRYRSAGAPIMRMMRAATSACPSILSMSVCATVS